ncbi:ATP-dependent zinc metalloprotease FtsH [Corynebacterium faecale]|uniref:ATP-dependent zinc metalloprotease FtsH n=1 Tax=Corynebacterium faecale TaxID=1758466 RepID=UPI0025B48C1A|nr:ATP-dependent zinc metalloprotease FtsH [Corynebacterium faecale]WJY93137.1 ATP-dependent zinc metalloprotease FtsH [Corynebacterium faecale]
MKNKKYLQYGGIAAVVLIVLFLFSLFTSDTRNFQEVDTSVAMEQLEAGNVAEAQIDDREQRVRLTLREPIDVEEREGVEEIISQYPARTAPVIFEKVEASGAESYTTNVTQDNFLVSMLSFILPMLIIFGLLIFFLSRAQGGGMFGMGGSKAKQLTKDTPTNTFADVAGADEAVDELHEIKDFLEDPTRYQELGAKIPRGVLLYGPPGTGKTLLARAVAGEAGVPFYSISGSDFVEMFVGVGASRVRDLFKQAKENSPCIIFIDEIDAVGRARGSGMGGGHDEREQTLNQLLVEMDGFGDRGSVILMAATNRPDVLDAALLRPGRFDRQIPVTAPDLRGREQILEIHAKGKPFAPDANIKSLAKRTAGMSGADLGNVLNEAALLTARIGGNVITADALEEATDRVIGGPRRSSKIISEQEKKVTAYHEGGHTLSAWALADIERVYKVTILARGRTGGHAMTAQEDDKGMYNRNELFARLVFAMGGRAAEELVFGAPTTGASADIEQATKIARAMVTEYGMSPAVGMVKYGEEQGDPFSGRGGGGTLTHSQEVAALIDTEVNYLLNKAHEVSYQILHEYRDHLDELAEKLLEKETLRRPDLEVLFTDIVPRSIDEVFPDEDSRFPQQEGREPVKTPVELAIERGEEPPKRFSIVEASKAARERRRKELEAQKPAGDTPAEVPGSTGSTPAPNRYGTPPPADWTVPGSANAGGTDFGGATRVPEQGPAPDTSRPNPYARKNHSGEHPGMKAYGFGDQELMDQSTGDEHTPGNVSRGNKGSSPGDAPTQVIGFRLPDHERPDHPDNSEPVEERPGMMQDAVDIDADQAEEPGADNEGDKRV